MSNEPSPEKKLPLHRRFLPTTLAGKSAAVTALVLVVILVVVWIFRLFGSQSVRLIHAVSPLHIAIEFALVILIPLVLYWGIRRWNQVIEGEFPDIDRAWEAGINALRAKGVSPSDYPIFLILGSAGNETEQGLMEALDTELTIHGVPDSSGVSHALQWYMSSDAIYLFCPGASSLSALMGRWSPASMNVAPGRIARRRTGGAAEGGSGATASPSTAAHGAATGLNGIQKIERAAPGPTAAPAGASKPTPLKKETAMRPAPQSPPPTPPSSQPQPYLGTIGQHAIDSSPQSGSPRETAATPPRSSAFDVPATKPQPRSGTPAADTPRPQSTSPASGGGAAGEALRPAPRYEGTISFDQYPPSQPSAPAQPAGSHTRAATADTTQATATPPRALGRPSEASDSTPHRIDDAKASPGSARPTQPLATSNAPLALHGSGGHKKVALPASLDTSDQIPRLRYVCKLLQRARRPMCGINGAVTLIPFELSRVGPLQLSAIAQSARNDVETIQQTLGVRCPVTAMLVGLEQDKGFTELVRRLQSGLLSRRLGGRFDLRSRPTPDELNTHSDRLCDAFEDWVYRLFSREDGLAQQRGNRKLYALACKIRHELKPRLRIVLGQAFGCESSEQDVVGDNDDSFFFSGCYFAASGATTGQPAFVRGVFKDKLVDEQSKVQWTPESRRKQHLLTTFTILGWIIALLLTALLVVQNFVVD
ncbi:type VI secretion protein IcmF/TssM N-terminal domain-containing protein [Rhodopirellula sp. JC639]|uniref:type VI secretion protein IcmF/TssM N-terminal domain-containing protein n=1 Tax=Stieleria mannarensis TaxID=2755585 RepID=UPI00160209D2|nr:type VI secretion protein IcmF/TssM N-terminal domain-containing protein [Rhodopirellula sp. JC639]